MESESAKVSNQVKVIYADYDYKTGEHSLKFGNAIIDKVGVATIQASLFGVLQRQPGEYILASCFEHEWKSCMKQRAKEMAQEMAKSGAVKS